MKKPKPLKLICLWILPSLIERYSLAKKSNFRHNGVHAPNNRSSPPALTFTLVGFLFAGGDSVARSGVGHSVGGFGGIIRGRVSHYTYTRLKR